MLQLPVWVLAASAAGIIAAGIGLGYLIIALFWRRESRYTPRPVTPPVAEPVKEIKEPVEIPEEPPEKMESVRETDIDDREEYTPAMTELESNEQNTKVRFTTVLHSRFNHSFDEVNTIVCWDIGLEDCDQVRDTEGKVLKFRAIAPQTASEQTKYVLTDESGNIRISVVSGKEYVKKETNLDVDKMKMP